MGRCLKLLKFCFIIIYVSVSVIMIAPGGKSESEESRGLLIEGTHQVLCDKEKIYPIGDAYIIDGITRVYATPERNVLRTLSKGDRVKIIGTEGNFGKLSDGGYIALRSVSKSKLIEIPIRTDGKNSKEYKGYLNAVMSILPEELLSDLSISGCSITITDYDIGKDNRYGEGSSQEGWVAVTITSDDSSSIYYECEKRGIDLSAIHEIGHAFDATIGYASDMREFEEIWKIESSYLASDYFKESKSEYFAESFNLYFTSSGMRNVIPETFRYLDGVLERYI